MFRSPVVLEFVNRAAATSRCTGQEGKAVWLRRTTQPLPCRRRTQRGPEAGAIPQEIHGTIVVAATEPSDARKRWESATKRVPDSPVAIRRCAKIDSSNGAKWIYVKRRGTHPHQGGCGRIGMIPCAENCSAHHDIRRGGQT